ncbi:MAG: hypothetical protein EOP89_01275, partial [Lysobacteraceae bacterium]
VNAVAGNQDFAGTFKNLGISLRDSNGGIKDAGKVTLELADKFKNMKDGAEKAAIATKVFGKSGFELIPFLDQGSAGIKAFALAIDADFAKRSEVFNDSLRLIGLNAKNSALEGLKTLLPTLQELADAFIEFTKGGGDSLGIFTAIGEAARIMAIGVSTSATLIANLVDSAITGLRELKALATGNLNDINRLDQEYQKRIRARAEANVKFVNDVRKNSVIFGEGTQADIEARQKAATKPELERKKDGLGGDTIGENQKILKTFDERIAKLRAEAAAVGDSNVKKQAGVLIAELESKGIDKSSRSYAVYSQKITAAVTALEAAKEKQASRDLVRKEQESFELQQLQLNNYSLSSAELQKLTVNKELDNQATEATINFTKEGKAAYLEATEAVKAQRIALIDLQTQQKQSYGAGAQQALRDYLEAAKDVASQTKAAFSQAFANIEDSLVDFVKTGKISFKKFADDVIDQLIRISIKSVAVSAITGGQSLFGGLFGGATTVATAGGGEGFGAGLSVAAKGGVMTGKGMATLQTYARGGIATRPQLAVFGEGSGPEAYVPLPDGRTIPVSMKGGGGQSNSVSIVVNMDGSGESSRSSSEDGRQLGVAIKNAVQAELLNQRRPGGILA